MILDPGPWEPVGRQIWGIVQEPALNMLICLAMGFFKYGIRGVMFRLLPACCRIEACANTCWAAGKSGVCACASGAILIRENKDANKEAPERTRANTRYYKSDCGVHGTYNLMCDSYYILDIAPFRRYWQLLRTKYQQRKNTCIKSSKPSAIDSRP